MMMWIDRVWRMDEYIAGEFKGTKSAFAQHMRVRPQQVSEWIRKDFIVVDDVIYSRRRSIPTYRSTNDGSVRQELQSQIER